MLFNSYEFIFIFLPITFIVYFYLNSKRLTEIAKGFLIFGIVSNVSLLGYFKYADFFIENFNLILGSNIELLHLLLPLAMSFKNRVAQICKSENIEFKNYLTIKELKDIHFYDLSHLNLEGSIVFTKKILNDFKISKKEIND